VAELLVAGADVAAGGADQIGAKGAAKHALRDVVCTREEAGGSARQEEQCVSIAAGSRCCR
jgi:hypothetical protein